jgi:GNAT superfamily N-acetyltransferase
MSSTITINIMVPQDIDAIVEAFTAWQKRHALYERYWQEQLRNERVIFVARDRDLVVGYTALIWQSGYEHFRMRHIPEIVDLNVIEAYQHRGIGTALIHAAERYVLRHEKDLIGISVVQSDEYAAANRLYPYLNYQPDGYGITPYDRQLHLIKRLR